MGKTSSPYPSGKLKLYKCNRQTKGEPLPVQMIYVHKSVAVRRATGVNVKESDWNSKENNGRGGVRASYGRDFRNLNARLLKKVEETDARIMEWCDKHPGEMTLDMLKALLDGKSEARDDRGIDFATYTTDLLLSEKQRNKIGQSVYENGRSAMNIFGLFLKAEKLGTYDKDKIYVSEITPSLIEKYIIWRKEFKGNSDETINHALTPILKACKRAVIDGYISQQTNAMIQDMRIASAVSLEEGSTSEVKHLSKEQIQKLVDFYNADTEPRRKEYIEMFLFAMYACGLRFVDMLTLQWSDIDLERQTLNKIQVKTRNRNVVPLTPDAIRILEKWKGRHTRFVFGLLPDGFNLDDSQALIKARNSKTRSINQSLTVVGEKVGMSFGLTFHVARHTFAVQALNSGVEMTKVSQLLGHGSSEITEKVYAHYLSTTLHQTLQVLNLPSL